MRILLIARTYPPEVGGIERFAEQFYIHLSKIADVKLHNNPRGKKTLFSYIFKLLFFLIFHGRDYEIIHFCDGVLSPFIPLIKMISKAKISLTVHGLDVVYSKWGYQIWTPFCLRLADLIIPVSRYTYDECIKRGVKEESLTIIHNGINLESFSSNSSIKTNSLIMKLGINGVDDKVLLTVGRLVKRKGHAWFIENVFMKLDESYKYIIVGDGPERQSILDIISVNNLQSRVKLTGYISDLEKESLFSNADQFIMPNIRVPDDQEGFGIVILEAGYYSVPVIATDIEGIHDAVLDGITGRLITEKDVSGFVEAIQHDNIARSHIKQAVLDHFSWDAKIQEYKAAFTKLAN